MVLSEIPQNDERNLPGNEIMTVDNQSIAKAVEKNTLDNEAVSQCIEDQNEASSITVFGQEVKIKKRPVQRKKRYAKRKTTS